MYPEYNYVDVSGKLDDVNEKFVKIYVIYQCFQSTF
jgi:hypothetical protein